MAFRVSLTKGGKVFVKSGKYQIQESIRIPPKLSVWIWGERGTKLIFEPLGGRPMFILGNGSNLTIQDLKIVYDGRPQDFVICPKSARFTSINVKITSP